MHTSHCYLNPFQHFKATSSLYSLPPLSNLYLIPYSFTFYHYRSTGIALDAASSLCSSGRIYDISSRSSRSREMSRKSSTASTSLKRDTYWMTCAWKVCLAFITRHSSLHSAQVAFASLFCAILTFLRKVSVEFYLLWRFGRISVT